MCATVLITGGAKRIGREISLAFANAGYRVVVHYNHSADAANELLKELGGDGHCAVQCDFNDMTAVSALFSKLVSEGIVPDVLVNNASLYTRMPLVKAEIDETAAAFLVNFAAPFELMRAFAEICGKGAVINITDQRTAFPDPAAGPYALAKKALQEASYAAALEWAPAIRVNCVAPGIVIPPPGKSWDKMQPLLDKIPLKKRSTPEEIAAACLFLAQSSSITGQTLFVDGGLHLLGHSVETAKPNGL